MLNTNEKRRKILRLKRLLIIGTPFDTMKTNVCNVQIK